MESGDRDVDNGTSGGGDQSQGQNNEQGQVTAKDQQQQQHQYPSQQPPKDTPLADNKDGVEIERSDAKNRSSSMNENGDNSKDTDDTSVEKEKTSSGSGEKNGDSIGVAAAGDADSGETVVTVEEAGEPDGRSTPVSSVAGGGADSISAADLDDLPAHGDGSENGAYQPETAASFDISTGGSNVGVQGDNQMLQQSVKGDNQTEVLDVGDKDAVKPPSEALETQDGEKKVEVSSPDIVLNQVSAEAAADGLSREVASLEADLEDFFSSVPPLKGGEASPKGLFPALENVDFETDEEGLEAEKEGRKEHANGDGGKHQVYGGGGESQNGQSLNGDGGDTQQRAEADGARSMAEVMGAGEQKEKESKMGSERLAYVSGDEEGNNGHIAILNSPRSLHKDYPLNYQNYKVCRELEPGVKECLILETGELFICVNKPESATNNLPDPYPNERGARRSVFMVQPDHGLTNTKSGNSQEESGGWQPVTTTANLVSNSEAFAYVSLEGSTGQPEADAAGTVLQGSQHAYITENGIPVILDNAEDDVKIELQAEMGRLGMGPQQHAMTSPEIEKDSLVTGDVVEDILSGNERDGMPSTSPQEERPTPGKKSKRKKEKKEKFVELQPDIAADSTEDTATMSESEVNVNNSNVMVSHEDEEVEGNVNCNANSPEDRERELLESETYSRPTAYSTDRLSRVESSDFAPSYNRYSSDSRGADISGSRSYSQSPYRGRDSYADSRGYRSRDKSSYYRSGEPSSVDSSRISTRYSRIERSDPRSSSSRPESVTVPKFKTLHDQQVSWLEMFKMIEKQHRSELQAQYMEHQKILQEMQKNMENELNKQQNTLKKRLHTHREILQEFSPGRPRPAAEGRNLNQSQSREGDTTSMDSQRTGQMILTDHSSHITLQGVPVSLKNPPPMARYQSDCQDIKSSEDLPVKRSLEKEFSSPTRPADTSLNMPRIPLGGDKQLRGGVYSSPMPLAKVKHKNSPRGNTSNESSQHSSPREVQGPRNTNAAYRGDSDQYQERQPVGSADVSITESEEVLSPRTRISLREKHAKHLADLRAYYEEELREMRQLLSSKQERDRRDMGDEGGSMVTAGEKILAGENHELRQKCHQLQDAYHDAKVEVRELQQKLQGLEIRAADYAQRYDTTQAQVLSLKSRLEELTEYAKEKEAIAGELELKHKRASESLQLAYKKEKELTESLHNAKTTIQRLVDKYETLEKDHELLKESSSEVQEKLYSSRAESIEANNKLSRLELENKQLKHDMEILKHEVTMARSALQMRTSYEDAYHTSGSPGRGRLSYSSPQVSRARSADTRSYGSQSQERPALQKEHSPESESDSDYLRSPIIRAERELKKLQQSQEFTPKLQRKFYGTEVPSTHGGPPITVNRSSNRSSISPQAPKSLSPRDRKVRVVPQGKEISRSNPSSSSNARRNLSTEESGRLHRGEEKVIGTRSYKGQDCKDKDRSISSKKSGGLENGLTGEEAMDKIRSGEIVSRPAWEDVYTSLAPARQSNSGSKGSPMNYTRDQVIRERLQNIENLERKYDDLCNEKRKYESALSKVPAYGHRGEKDKLEKELDRVDRELGSVRMSLKRYHVLKSTI